MSIERREDGAVVVHPLKSYDGVGELVVSPIDAQAYVGPTEEANWVLLGRLLVGAYPSAIDDDLNAAILTSILQLGVTTFVCLQAEYQHTGVTEDEWRQGQKLRPYIYDAMQLLEDKSVFPDPATRPSGLNFVHFPIVDCDTASDDQVVELCRDLVRRLNEGEVLYVHCWGGHGRTGTVVSIMLGIIYDLDAPSSMGWVQTCHDMRLCPMGVPSPQTDEQRAQVARILGTIQARRLKSRQSNRAMNPPASARRPAAGVGAGAAAGAPSATAAPSAAPSGSLTARAAPVTQKTVAAAPPMTARGSSGLSSADVSAGTRRIGSRPRINVDAAPRRRVSRAIPTPGPPTATPATARRSETRRPSTGQARPFAEDAESSGMIARSTLVELPPEQASSAAARGTPGRLVLPDVGPNRGGAVLEPATPIAVSSRTSSGRTAWGTPAGAATPGATAVAPAAAGGAMPVTPASSMANLDAATPAPPTAPRAPVSQPRASLARRPTLRSRPSMSGRSSNSSNVGKGPVMATGGTRSLKPPVGASKNPAGDTQQSKAPEPGYTALRPQALQTRRFSAELEQENAGPSVFDKQLTSMSTPARAIRGRSSPQAAAGLAAPVEEIPVS